MSWIYIWLEVKSPQFWMVKIPYLKSTGELQKNPKNHWWSSKKALFLWQGCGWDLQTPHIPPFRKGKPRKLQQCFGKGYGTVLRMVDVFVVGGCWRIIPVSSLFTNLQVMIRKSVSPLRIPVVGPLPNGGQTPWLKNG